MEMMIFLRCYDCSVEIKLKCNIGYSEKCLRYMPWKHAKHTSLSIHHFPLLLHLHTNILKFRTFIDLSQKQQRSMVHLEKWQMYCIYLEWRLFYIKISKLFVNKMRCCDSAQFQCNFGNDRIKRLMLEVHSIDSTQWFHRRCRFQGSSSDLLWDHLYSCPWKIKNKFKMAVSIEIS